MGIPFSCPLAAYTDIENGIESVIVKSICFGDDEEAKTTVRSISFKNQDFVPTITKSVGSGKMIEGSVSFRGGDDEIMDSLKAPLCDKELVIRPTSDDDDEEIKNQSLSSDGVIERSLRLPVFDSSNPKHQAAIKLQKVYKSFRTRRKLADCAVLIEQSWWKLLDFAELKRSSISFFDLEKHETAISRWSRARTRAAKVGKGLSKNGKARKLALQHWLEAIDPRHRYGHNLHFYYVKWLHSQSNEPFFYWLDIGEGKEINLVEKCSRSKLHQQCIKYLGPMERMAYEVAIEDGKLFYKQTGEFLDTSEGTKGSKWIFVLSTSRILYVGKKKKGTFQHSSFLAGGATLAAGRIVVEDGILKAVWPHSGHYRPTPENFQDFITFLKENNVDITDVKTESIDDEEECVGKKSSSSHTRSHSSDEDMNVKDHLETEELNDKDITLERSNSTLAETSPAVEVPNLSPFSSFSRKLPNIEIPKRDDLIVDGYETAEEATDSDQNEKIEKQNMFNEEEREVIQETIPDKELVLQRINSRKGMNSYQLGKQLSRKWSTGAGPRIGCLRDHPSGLQSHMLEQANLSPRSSPCVKSSTNSFRVFTPKPNSPVAIELLHSSSLRISKTSDEKPL